MILDINPKKIINKIRFGPLNKNLAVIGVSGTSGKTMLAHILEHVFKQAGYNTGFVSSIGYSTGDSNLYYDANANGISAGDLNTLLYEMVKNGVGVAIVEVTSKNLKKNIYRGVELDSGIITNINFNNPEFYKNFEEYAQTKINFINSLKDYGLLVLNQTDNGVLWLNKESYKIKKPLYTIWSNPNDVDTIKKSMNGLEFNYRQKRYNVPILGKSNVNNVVHAVNLLESYLDPSLVLDALKSFPTPKGKMEVVYSGKFTVVIDHSVAADQMLDALEFLNGVKPIDSKIISVFGVKGGVNTLNRRLGEVAAQFCGLVVLTADDPNSNDLADINMEICSYAEKIGGILIERFSSTEEYHMVNKDNLDFKIERIQKNNDIPFVSFEANDYTSRLDAIKFALSRALPGDVVYLTGKGHDNVLTFGNIIYEWSDHEAVNYGLKELNLI